MRRNLARFVALLSALALVAGVVGSATASNRPLVAVLRGSNEVPAADQDGRGVALIRRISATGVNDRLCYLLVASKIALPATGAHVHIGATGLNGAVQITLGNPSTKARVPGRGVGMARGCTDAADTLLDQIWAAPSGYYVNIHTSEYPGGAIRGQLN